MLYNLHCFYLKGYILKKFQKLFQLSKSYCHFPKNINHQKFLLKSHKKSDFYKKIKNIKAKEKIKYCHTNLKPIQLILINTFFTLDTINCILYVNQTKSSNQDKIPYESFIAYHNNCYPHKHCKIESKHL